MNVFRRGGNGAVAQVSEVVCGGVGEIFVCVHPLPEAGGIEAQARAGYRALFDALETCGVGPEDLATEKVFFSDVNPQFRTLEAVRREAYDRAGCAPDCGPATIFLHQPPADPGRLCAFQAHAFVSRGAGCVVKRALPDLPGLASGTVVDCRGMRRIYLMNLTGDEGPEGPVPMDFDVQTERMFQRAEACLRQQDASFRDVVRTWIYIAEIERDYRRFNPVRTAFFERAGVRRIPASTGIQGATYPWRRGCTMDVYALLSDASVTVEPMRSPTMNEAPSYGSSFSRGMAVTRCGWTTAYVSGTASIDPEGRVAHVGDPEGQVRRMLRNVEDLLGARGGSVADTAAAITYLKHPEDLATFRRVWAELGLPDDVPNTVAVADVCRPEWLCEIELIAFFPEGRG